VFRAGYLTDTNLEINQASTGNFVFKVNDSSIQMTVDADGLALLTGASVNNISSSTALGSSDTTLVTQGAVKSYVDTEIANIARDEIVFGDSYIKVYDGTAGGYAEVVIDGTQVQYWDDEAATIRMGKASGAGRIVISDTQLDGFIGSTQVLDFTEDTQLIGVSGDTYLGISQSTDTLTMLANGSPAASWSATGFQLYGSGAIVNTISSDVGLGSSDTTLVTQGAVKSYVDAQIGNVQNIEYVYADTTAVNGDIMLVDTTAGVVNIEMIESSEARVVIKKVTTDANDVIITASSGLIDGAASKTIDTAYQSITFVSDGINYFIL